MLQLKVNFNSKFEELLLYVDIVIGFFGNSELNHHEIKWNFTFNSFPDQELIIFLSHFNFEFFLL